MPFGTSGCSVLHDRDHNTAAHTLLARNNSRKVRAQAPRTKATGLGIGDCNKFSASRRCAIPRMHGERPWKDGQKTDGSGWTHSELLIGLVCSTHSIVSI